MTIAMRTLIDSQDPDTAVTVSIDNPIQVGDDWACTFRIDGMGIEEQAHGVDSLQALLLAVEGARRALQQSGRTLTWTIGGQPAGETGDTGLPRQVPTIVDLAERDRIDHMIDDAVNQWLAERARTRHP